MMTQALLRAGVFLSLITILGIAERRWPQNRTPPDRRRRWTANFALGALDVVAVRLLMPWLAVDAARWSAAHHEGILRALAIPSVPAAISAFLVLDLVIYSQHRLMHRLPLLWRLHRVHHTDVALDVSSAVRFHPLEILLSMLIKIAAVLLIGAAPGVVIAFEIVLNGFAVLTHANLALPARIDRALRVLFVTPDMHRIHHSVSRDEHDRNFGFHVSWWDRLFGSYRAQARLPQTQLRIGLPDLRAPADQGLPALLRQPFAAGQNSA